MIEHTTNTSATAETSKDTKDELQSNQNIKEFGQYSYLSE